MTIDHFSSQSQFSGTIRLTEEQIRSLIKSKERIYFGVSAVLGCLLWGIFIAGKVLTNQIGNLVVSMFFISVFFLFSGMILSAIIETHFFGISVRVSQKQFPAVDGLVIQCASALGMKKTPHVFVVPGRGILNAFAMKVFLTRFVILNAEVVDFALKRGKQDELKFIIAHELAHHAAGHLNTWQGILTIPTKLILFLPLALSRAREYSCDSIAAALVADRQTSARALMMLAHGSLALADHADIDQFVDQETHVPILGGFLVEIFSPHPRMTRRVANVLEG